jgi:thioredoxin-like negative regulator of GroEL
MSTDTSGQLDVGTSSGRPGDRILTVTSKTFEELVLDAEGPVVAEFMSYGCSHCRAMEPVLQQVAGMVEPEETVVRVNVAVEHALATSYDIQATPTFIMFLGGRELTRVEGPSPDVSTVLAALTQPFEQ